MAETRRKRLLLVVRHSPYGSSLARASIDAALAAAAFEQPVTLLFASDGVLHLLPDQDTAAIGRRNSGRLLSSLPLYDIETVYADRAAVECYSIDLAAAPLPTKAVDETGMRDLIAQCDHVLGF